MATPEHPNAPGQTDGEPRFTRFAALQRQLEVVDEIENPIERSFRREAVLEELDDLDNEIG